MDCLCCVLWSVSPIPSNSRNRHRAINFAIPSWGFQDGLNKVAKSFELERRAGSVERPEVLVADSHHAPQREYSGIPYWDDDVKVRKGTW